MLGITESAVMRELTTLLDILNRLRTKSFIVNMLEDAETMVIVEMMHYAWLNAGNEYSG